MARNFEDLGGIGVRIVADATQIKKDFDRELSGFRSQPVKIPVTFDDKGKLEELKAAYGDHDAEVLLVDDELDPVQQRALEDALSARVVDRTQLILDIFAQHATSAEGKLQVELAQLEYNLPRMRGM